MAPFCQQDPCQQISNNKIITSLQPLPPPPPTEQQNKSEYNSRSIYYF